MRVEVEPELLRWAYERARLDPQTLARRFPHLQAWEDRESSPTLKQLEEFAKATHAPVGFLLLPTPPEEHLPIPDFRTVRNAAVARPTPDLLETVYACQERQDWYRDFMRANHEERVPFVGTVTLASSVEETAKKIRDALGFRIEERKQLPTWTEALRRFVEQADDAGVLVMVSGIVGSNTHRKLDPEEFRGFALADDLAPLVFINGADTKAAQMFTLAHELAHVWLGQSALTDVAPDGAPTHDTEQWCNRVAAEVLVPLAAMRAEYRPSAPLEAEMQRLARLFKVSTLVVIRRIHDLGRLSPAEFAHAYGTELVRLRSVVRKESGGGNFYLTQAARVGKRFARALIVDTLEGQTLRRDAFRLMGFTKLETFERLGQSLGVEVG